MPFESPAGFACELVSGNQRASVTEVGGALRGYWRDDVALLDGYSAEAFCTSARGQTLAPWPNRIQDGKYRFGGQEFQAPLNEPEKRNAIHGLVRWDNWRQVEATPSRVELSYLLHAVPGYRFTLALSNTYELSDDGLSVTSRATNVGRLPCPYGTGAHPYLNVGQTLDETTVRAPGAVRLPTDARGIPTGRERVEGTAYDFREGRSLRGLQVDYAFTELERDAQDLAWVTLTTADASRAVSLWMDANYPFVELFTGDTLEDPSRRRTGLGVEPMSCPPNAFQTGEAVLTLEPGQSSTHRWGLVPGTPRPVRWEER